MIMQDKKSAPMLNEKLMGTSVYYNKHSSTYTDTN